MENLGAKENLSQQQTTMGNLVQQKYRCSGKLDASANNNGKLGAAVGSKNLVQKKEG
jgi:hypothetical protein